jgi:hypothetical protein
LAASSQIGFRVVDVDVATVDVLVEVDDVEEDVAAGVVVSSVIDVVTGGDVVVVEVVVEVTPNIVKFPS